jgi:hypothetical protein
VAPADKTREELASYVSERGAPSILVQREADGNDSWKRLNPGARLYGSDPLVSLPGYGSEVRLDSGVRVLLQGLLPEFSRDPAMDFMLESALTLHRPDKAAELDADLVLDRGRFYLINTKDAGPARVRLRFGSGGAEVWDLTMLDRGTEVGVDLQKAYTRDVNYRDGEDPKVECYLMVLQGRAQLKIDYEQFPLERGNLVLWDNKSGQHSPPTPVDPNLPIWKRPPPDKKENAAAPEMVLAVNELAKKMVDRNARKPGLALGEMLEGEGTLPSGRRLAIYCLGALGENEIRRLLDVLGDDDPTHFDLRGAAIFTLRRWLSRRPAQGKQLFDAATKTGLLLRGQKYRVTEAETIFTLLHDFPDTDRDKRETYELLANELLSDKVAIAELAYWHLSRLAPGVKLPPFNPAWPKEDRRAAKADILKLIEDGKLPPRPATGPAPDEKAKPPEKGKQPPPKR